MKFSIRFLLALIVLAALGVNGWQMQRRIRSLDAEIQQLQQSSRDRSVRLRTFDQQRVIYERFLAAEESRGREFAAAAPAFDRLVQKYGQFQSPEGDQFKMLSVPTYHTSDEAMQSWRVYVPQHEQVRLQVEFLDDAKKPLENATLFQPAVQQMLTIQPGDHVVSFRWLSQPEPRAQVELDGRIMLACDYLRKASGYGSGSVSMSVEYTPRHTRPIELIRFTPGGNTPADRRESIRLTILRQKPDDTP